jgi:hypothetical protein
LVPDGVERRHADDRGVERAVHARGYHPANRFAEPLGPGDELVGT